MELKNFDPKAFENNSERTEAFLDAREKAGNVFNPPGKQPPLDEKRLELMRR